MTIFGRELCPNMAGDYVFTGLLKRLSAEIASMASELEI
jgi:hypothetical protein